MSEENKDQTPSEHKYAELLDSFKGRVATSSTLVRDGVVDTLVNAEVDKRANTVIKTLERIQDINKEMNKIRPEATHVDSKTLEDIPGNLTREQGKKLRELKKKLNALDIALNKALADTDPDFQKLNELIK